MSLELPVLPHDLCRWYRGDKCSSPLVSYLGNSFSPTYCMTCRVHNHEPVVSPPLPPSFVSPAPVPRTPVSRSSAEHLCDHLGPAIKPPPGKSPKKSWHVCNAGHGDDGITCPCDCASCIHHTNPPPKTSVNAPEPSIVHGRPSGHFAVFVATNEGRGLVFRETLSSIREANLNPTVVVNSKPIPGNYAKSSSDYLLVLREALRQGHRFSLILEDDVFVDPDILAKLETISLLDVQEPHFFGLFIPDLIQSPWERRHPEHHYRVAKPLITSKQQPWQKYRLWGSQAYMFSQHALGLLIQDWNMFSGGQDARVFSILNKHRVPLLYSDPCLVEHNPKVSNFGTPPAYAPDYGVYWRPTTFFDQFPECVSGWLTYDEGSLLRSYASDLDVLELGTYHGRSTICLAQSARVVVTVDRLISTSAQDWAYRFGLRSKIVFVHADIGAVDFESGHFPQFGLVFVDSDHEYPSVRRDLAIATKLKPQFIAVHDYPDPSFSGVRRAVLEWLPTSGYRKCSQADYLAVFKRSES